MKYGKHKMPNGKMMKDSKMKVEKAKGKKKGKKVKYGK